MEYQPKFLDIGKQCIALSLLLHERTERLFDDWVTLRSGGKTDLKSNDGKNWYDYLFGRLATDFDKFGDNSLSVITFNYDRSLEHYLFTSLKNKYSKSDSECAAQLERIPIIHVHGQLGQLPWKPQSIPVVQYDVIEYTQSQFRNTPGFDKAAGRTSELRALALLVEKAAKHIKIIHESDVADAFGEAHDLLRNAKRIYFLGFGFNMTNVLRLFSGVVLEGNKMRGTCLGISPHVKRELQQIGIPMIEGIGNFMPGSFEPLTIYQFLFNDSKGVLN